MAAMGKLILIAGLRYDDISAYASVWSPKLALQYRVTEKLRVNASVEELSRLPISGSYTSISPI
jgi:outer membrane receptor for ferrienterochelin and colicin